MSDDILRTSNKLTFATVIACVLLFAASIGAVSYTFYQREGSQRDVNAAVCRAVVRLDGAISESLRRSLDNIPKLAYYQHHPAEMRSQLREVRRSIRKFVPPPECGKEALR